uniref:MINDY deubiquitinase domain-containing protein n=1 Tax=Daphnia galeata TaxID=27404 RepID=A0A8J2RZ50_9CRUS|nr:unnamed protein product [Daphnia galeata]
MAHQFKHGSSELGLNRLLSKMEEEDFALFFSFNEYRTIYKFEGKIYQLVTNCSYIMFTEVDIRRTGPVIRSPSYGPEFFNFFVGPYVAKFGP